MDVRTLMRRSARYYADQEAVVDGDRRLTFAEAWERGLRLANGLLALGLRPGDRVGVLEDNCLSAADAYLGLTAANLVRVPLYPRNSREAHAHMLGHTGCVPPPVLRPVHRIRLAHESTLPSQPDIPDLPGRPTACRRR